MSNTKYKTAVYLRLSKGDEDIESAGKGESNSISSQRLIIEGFLENNPELEVVDEYVDDGYTGTNFDRPAMQRMLQDIDDGLVDCVIVKDFSRFGREKIETGTFILKTCKEKNIRFISINDNYDSLTANGSDKHLLMPIKTLTNEFYSMDISSKVRASQAVKRSKGEFMGPYAPYGYIKDPEDKNHLLINPETARVVKTIYAKRISGMSANAIAEYLKDTGVLTPANYKRKHIPGCKVVSNTDKCKWSAKQVLRILENEVYLGSVVQGREYNVSFKVNKKIYRPKEEWDVVKGMHEPIISQSDYDIVQSLLSRDIYTPKGRSESYLFSGMLFCGDCGGPMLRKKRTNKKESRIEYICKGYNDATGCHNHKILDEDLTAAVLASVNNMIRRLCIYSDLAANLENVCISREEAIQQNEEINKLKEEIERCDVFRQGLYRDMQDGMLTRDQFERFQKQYGRQIEELTRAIEERKLIIEELYSKGLAASEFIEKFREQPDIEKLDKVLLVTLIDRILIYKDGSIEIVYRYTDQIAALDEIVSATEEVE